MSLPVRLSSFDPEEKVVFESSSFLGMYYQGSPLLWWRVFFGFFALFACFEPKDHLSRGLAFYSKLLNESLEVILSWVFRMIT
jgi:hypothetical protein